jgi:hypothetical protein
VPGKWKGTLVQRPTSLWWFPVDVAALTMVYDGITVAAQSDVTSE